MKQLILVLLLFSTTLNHSFAQSKKEIGYLINKDDEKIAIYLRPEKVGIFNKVGEGCDCKFEKANLYYFDENGKAQKIKESKIKQLTLEPGTIECKTQAPVYMGKSAANPLDISIVRTTVENTTTYLLLKTYKTTKKKYLHKVVAQNDKYMLTSRIPDNTFDGKVFILSTTNQRLIEGPILHSQVDQSRKGKKFYESVREKYFPGCTALFEKIEAMRPEAEKSWKRGREIVYLLSNISGVECE